MPGLVEMPELGHDDDRDMARMLQLMRPSDRARTLQLMSIDVAEACEHVPLSREHDYSNLPTLIDAPHGRGHVYVTTAEAGAPESSRFNGSDDEPPARQHNKVPFNLIGHSRRQRRRRLEVQRLK